MQKLYEHLDNHLRISPNMEPAFTYLSATSGEFLQYVTEFLNLYSFPVGNIILRRKFLKDILTFKYTYKKEHIRSMVDHYPERTFIYFGDSGERDPEVLAEFYRELKEKKRESSMGCIFIRKLDSDGWLTWWKNRAARFEAAFSGVPREKYYIFEKPEELLYVDMVNGHCRPQ
jgi:phosphatidate phosphatase APP1